eukprot:TRINITY_DN11246_c0_g1_i1.p1 TRINITY_DN11246_c0_g1~~TRINITY_DN11246_c0_g1_i1.p1  ORF type:complete len:205 (-),score=40.63 TRINITY_DN11246_c0_g1_i1:235-849(-)
MKREEGTLKPGSGVGEAGTTYQAASSSSHAYTGQRVFGPLHPDEAAGGSRGAPSATHSTSLPSERKRAAVGQLLAAAETQGVIGASLTDPLHGRPLRRASSGPQDWDDSSSSVSVVGGDSDVSSDLSHGSVASRKARQRAAKSNNEGRPGGEYDGKDARQVLRERLKKLKQVKSKKAAQKRQEENEEERKAAAASEGLPKKMQL